MTKNLLVAVSSAALLFATSAYADGGPVEETPPPDTYVEPDPGPEPAPAYTPPAEPEYNWYTTIFAGATFGDSVEVNADAGFGPLLAEDYEVPMEMGYLLGWTLGYDNLFGGDTIKFRPEVELSFRQQDADLEELVEDLFGPGAPDLDPLALSNDLLTLMGNVWIDFDLGGGMTPYLGGGVGIGWVDTAIVESTDFAWQFGGGVNFDVSSRVFLGLGYRYLGASFEEDIDFLGPVTVEWDYRAHEVMANLGVRF